MKVEMAVSISNLLIAPVAMPMLFIVEVLMVVPQPTGPLGLCNGSENELSNTPNRYTN